MTDDQTRLKELFIKYNWYIYAFEKFIDKIYKENKESVSKEKYKGYIVNLKEYENIKDNIEYKKVKPLLSSQGKPDFNKIVQNFNPNKFNSINKLKQIEFKTARYLFYKITNQENYIIINEELWNLIGCLGQNNNDSPINYTIEKENQIEINFENGDNIYIRSNDDNIISQYSFNYSIKKEEYKYYVGEYKNIIKDINTYYSIEKEFEDNLNKKDINSINKSGYLISNIWINQWKKITNYENIKNLIKENNTKIADEIVYYLENNKYKYSDLPPLEIFNFQTKNEIDDFLLNDSLVIINSDFKQSFKIKSKDNITTYVLNKNQISVNLDKNMIFNLNKNIIKSKENLLFIKQMFKIIKLKPNKDINNNIYLINKKILDKFKQILDYNKICHILKNNNIIDMTNNNNFDEYFSEIIKFIKEDKEYMDKINNINLIDEFNFLKCDYKLSIKHNEIMLENTKINFIYFSDFILVNKDILLFLYENNIINIEMKEQLYQSNYIINDEKILLVLKDKENKNLYEIGYIDINGNFIVEYIIKETNETQGKIEIACKTYGIKKLVELCLGDENNNQIKGNKNDLIGYFIKIQDNEQNEKNNQKMINDSNKEINNINDISKNVNENYIIKIISIFQSLHSFEKEIKTKLEESLNKNIMMKQINNNQNENEQYFLINNNFIFQLKSLCNYNQIEQFLDKLNNNNINEFLNNKDYINSIISNINEINSLFNYDKYKIENKDIDSYSYLNNFYILNRDSCAKLYDLDKNIGKISEYEINFGFNCGKIILKLKNNEKNVQNSNFYIYIYSLEQKYADIIDYNIYSLFIYPNINDMNNHFVRLINEENLTNYLAQINNNNNFKYILIDKTKLKDKDGQDSYILYNIILYNEYSLIEQNKDSKIYFLINRDFMQKLELILYYNEIKQILLNNNQINTMNIYNGKEEKQILVKNVKDLLSLDLIDKINKINKENILQQLNSINALNFQNYNYQNNNISYFNNCQVINGNICALIQTKLIPNFNLDKECFINDNKNVIAKLNEETICLGDLSKDNLFQVKYIYYSKDVNYINNVVNNFRINNINSIQNDSNYSQVIKINLYENQNINNNININNNNISNLSNNLSDKLVSLIYLSYFSQKKLLEKNNVNVRVILLNKKWFSQFYYEKINYLISQTNFQSEAFTINDIISKLDINILSQIDQNLPNNIQIDQSIFAESEIFQLKDKQIKVYKEFIMAKFDDFQTFIIKFTGNKNSKVNLSEQIGYFNKQNEDIIFIGNGNDNTQNYLFIGKINELNNSYDIQFILDYQSYYILGEQKNLIMNNNLNDYFIKYIILNPNNNDDLLSPIIYNNKIIGDCYKCIPNFNNFSKCHDYGTLINNDIFQKTIKLFFNYQKIYQNLNNNKQNIKKEKYYLVNRSFISQLKQYINFMEFCSFLVKGGVFNTYPIDIFNAVKLLKNTPLEELKKFFGKKEIQKIENHHELLEIGIIPVKYYDNNIEKYIMIYNDFEIIEEKIIELFVDINLIQNYLINCIINEGKIMILYPKDFDQEKRGVTVLGKISDELNFVTEYILVYDNSEIRDLHTQAIYGNLNNYIKDFKFVNHCQPIHDNNYKILGTVVDYAQYDTTSNINTPAYNPKQNNTPTINQNYNIFNQDIKNPIHTPIPIPKPIPKDDIRNSFMSPTLIGLENIGATCYMNATIQCFCHIDKFVNFFKYNKQAKYIYDNKMEDKLSYSFKILIEQLWPDNIQNITKKYYAPYDFKEKISKMNSLFEGVAANDSKDLVNFIIMTLHEELNKSKVGTNFMNSNINLDQRNKDLVFNNFIQGFMASNQSIISDIFYGVNCNITQCQNCLSKNFNYQTYFFLIFPLEEVRKFKIQNNLNINEMIDIYDCFHYNQKIDFMFGENAMYCNYCQQTFNSCMSTILTVSPEVLIIILNRGKGIQYKIQIKFYEDLNLENFVEHKETGCKYKLIGVITHLGGSDMSGHFIAYCKDPISNQWYQFNDAMVNPVKDFQKEVIFYAMPYLLFYQKVSQ